jgi:hypothetical protein
MSTEIASIRSGLPPGPKGTIVGGNSHQFRTRLLDFLLDTARDYGQLAGNRAVRAEMGARAREAFEAHWDKEQALARWEEVLMVAKTVR